MPKILPNRISRLLSADNLKAIDDGLALVKSNLGAETPITDKDFASLAKLGEKLKPYNDELFKLMQLNPQYLGKSQPIEEIEKDKIHFEQYEAIREKIQEAIDKLEREQAIVGAEYRNAGSVFEENVKKDAAQGIEAAVLLLDKIKRLDKPGPHNAKNSGKKPSPAQPA